MKLILYLRTNGQKSYIEISFTYVKIKDMSSSLFKLNEPQFVVLLFFTWQILDSCAVS